MRHTRRCADAPKTRDGAVEAIRALRVARCGAVKARTQVTNQLAVTAPIDVIEAHGLVIRGPHPTDRRATMVSLTEQGTAAANRMDTERRAPPTSFWDTYRSPTSPASSPSLTTSSVTSTRPTRRRQALRVRVGARLLMVSWLRVSPESGGPSAGSGPAVHQREDTPPEVFAPRSSAPGSATSSFQHRYPSGSPCSVSASDSHSSSSAPHSPPKPQRPALPASPFAKRSPTSGDIREAIRYTSQASVSP